MIRAHDNLPAQRKGETFSLTLYPSPAGRGKPQPAALLPIKALNYFIRVHP